MRAEAFQLDISFDAKRKLLVCFVSMFAAFLAAGGLPCRAATSTLAVINGSISSSEEGPTVSSDYRFLSGDYLYFTFEIAGFEIDSEERGEIRKISLEYEVRVEDELGRDLAEPISDKVQTELNPQDKNWVPKRRTSFLLPSFLAAGAFRVHTTVSDLLAKTKSSRDFTFQVGGIHVKPAESIAIENFQFLRLPDDKQPLSVPAFSPGDTVYARFDMTGFQNGPGNEHHVSYGVTVLNPAGKAFIHNPSAADLQASSFYPAQFIPGEMELEIGKNNPHGEYIVILKVEDLLAKKTEEIKQAFSIE